MQQAGNDQTLRNVWILSVNRPLCYKMLSRCGLIGCRCLTEHEVKNIGGINSVFQIQSGLTPPIGCHYRISYL